MKPIAKDSMFYKEVTEDELEKINARLNSMDYETLKDPGMWVNLYTEDQFLFDIIFLYIVFLRMNLDPPSTTTGNKKGWILSTRRNFSPNNPIFTMDNLRVLLSMMHMVRNIRIGQDLQEMMVLKTWKSPYNCLVLVVPSGIGKSTLKKYLPKMMVSVKMVTTRPPRGI